LFHSSLGRRNGPKEDLLFNSYPAAPILCPRSSFRDSALPILSTNKYEPDTSDVSPAETNSYDPDPETRDDPVPDESEPNALDDAESHTLEPVPEPDPRPNET